VADGGGARPKSARESGLPVAGGGGPGAGSGGEARALERRGPRGVETGGRVEQRERGASGSVAARQRGKRREKMGVPGVGVPRGAGVPWGLAPTGGRRPTTARRVGRGTVTGGGAADRWDRPVSGHGGERGRAWAGPRRKRGGRAQMNSKVLYLFELV
jgi:hypothetical protein